jgi:hypothetical protein
MHLFYSSCIGEHRVDARLVYSCSGSFNRIPTVFYKNVFNFDVQTENFYSKTMESYLSIIIRNHGYGTLRRKLNG